MERRLGADWMAGWWRGIPDERHLPGRVNVHEILRLWTYAKGMDMVEFGKMRYNLLGNADHWFPGTNAAQFDKIALVEALSENPFAERIPEILKDAHAMLFTEPKKPLIQKD
jgi:predicted aldo/keto reductase-like oxidoreductase